MIEEVIARRYAKALAMAAIEKNELNQTREDVERLADLLDPDMGDISVPELADFLQTPTVTVTDKIKMTDVLCTKLQIGKLVSDFLNVLINHRRTQLASRILRHYILMVAELENIDEAIVHSAKPLSDQERELLAKALEKKVGRKVRILVAINKNLLAGLQVKIGDLLFEGSLKGRLKRLEKALD